MLTHPLQTFQARIRERWYPHFTWVQNESAPWTPLALPLPDATLALLSTCGLYEADSQLPFDAWNDVGDPSFRPLHLDAPADRWRIAHSHYDHAQVNADASVALPVQHFTQLVQEGRIGRLHPIAYSFMGYLPEPRQLIEQTAPQVAKRLAQAEVHAAFLTPC